MKRRILLIPLLLIIGVGTAVSQGLHYTQNHYSRVLFNPAQAGAFKGTYRVQAIIRDQNRSEFNTSYQSPMVSVDSPFMWGFKKNHWVGGGITLFRDVAGDAGLGTNGFIGNAAYHIGLDKDLKRVITLGAHYGFLSRFIGNEWTTNTSINSSGPGALASMMRGEGTFNPDELSAGYSTLAVGMLFKTPLGDKSSLELGAAGSNLVNPRYEILASRNQAGFRINGQATINVMLGDALAFAPTAFYSLQGESQNLNLQANFAYQLNKEKSKKGRRGSQSSDEEKDPILLLPGIGYRMNDASSLQFMIGMEYQKWRVGLAYDLAVSGYSELTPHTAFELGLQRIFAIKKKPEIKPIIFCPRI